MNLKGLLMGAGLELVYLFWLISSSMPSFDVTPIVAELLTHALFQFVVLTIILVGAFMNGKKE